MNITKKKKNYIEEKEYVCDCQKSQGHLKVMNSTKNLIKWLKSITFNFVK